MSQFFNILSTWFTLDSRKCLDNYSEVQFSEALTPKYEKTGDLIVYNNTREKRYAALDLGVKISLCGSFEVYTTNHKNVFLRMVDSPMDRYKILHIDFLCIEYMSLN